MRGTSGRQCGERHRHSGHPESQPWWHGSVSLGLTQEQENTKFPGEASMSPGVKRMKRLIVVQQFELLGFDGDAESGLRLGID
jgi:hypothetical protein